MFYIYIYLQLMQIPGIAPFVLILYIMSITDFVVFLEYFGPAADYVVGSGPFSHFLALF